jgi:hypothetical protein
MRGIILSGLLNIMVLPCLLKLTLIIGAGHRVRKAGGTDISNANNGAYSDIG